MKPALTLSAASDWTNRFQRSTLILRPMSRRLSRILSLEFVILFTFSAGVAGVAEVRQFPVHALPGVAEVRQLPVHAPPGVAEVRPPPIVPAPIPEMRRPSKRFFRPVCVLPAASVAMKQAAAIPATATCYAQQ